MESSTEINNQFGSPAGPVITGRAASAPLLRKIGYGLGDMSSSMFWKIFSYFLPFFYANIYGLTLVDAGYLMLVTRIWDAVSDPMMGVICDRTHTRWGKYRPYLLWIAVPFAVCGILLFTTPETSYGIKLLWAYFTYILMMTCYTAINVPYGAMLDVITPSSAEKTVYSSYRMVFAYAGSFIALLSWEPLCRYFSGLESTASIDLSTPQSWQLAMCVIGGVCSVLFLLCFKLTREVVSAKSDASVGNDLGMLITNRPWWIMNGVAIFNNFYNIIRGSAVAFLFANIIGDTVEVKMFTFVIGTGVFLSIGELVNMVSVPLAVPLAARLGKKNTFILSLLIVIATCVAFWFCPITEGGVIAMVGLQIIFAVGLGISSPLVWSMYADVANYSLLVNHTASTGLIFSSASMAQKFGSAFGGAAVMWILAWFGYDKDLGLNQPEEALVGIRAMMSWIPAGLAAIGCLLLFIYPLNNKKMREIESQLAERSRNENDNHTL